MALSFAALQHAATVCCAGIFLRSTYYKHFLAVSQSLNCPCGYRTAKCVRRETLAGVAFRWARLSTQHHNSCEEEEKGRTSFRPAAFFSARRLSASALPSRLACARWYLEVRKQVQRAAPSASAVQAVKERGLPLGCGANTDFHASRVSSG